MRVNADPPVTSWPTRPWFHRRRSVTLVIAGCLFAGVFLLRLTVGDSGDAISMLFALPVTLVAVAFGRSAGVTASLVGVGLTGCWAWVSGTDISAIGWVSRAVPLLLVGGLVGDASDRLLDFEQECRRLERTLLRHRQAVEINDSLVQGMAAAKWSIEAGRVESGLEMLNETLDRGHHLVSQLIRESEQHAGGGSRAVPGR